MPCAHSLTHPNGNCQSCGEHQDAYKRAARERFRNVILLAGYKNPDPILEEWFEKYYAVDRDKFFAMMAQYEEDYKKDGEIV